MEKKFRMNLIRLSVLLALVYFATTGSDCEKALLNNGNSPSQLVGTWTLVDQSGALMDICPGESATFQESGTVNLTCPNSSTVTRSYTVDNNVLKYTESGVEYDFEFLNNDSNLAFYGRNVSRNLIYERGSATETTSATYDTQSSFNSSEAPK